jgi:hypothetical protein
MFVGACSCACCKSASSSGSGGCLPLAPPKRSAVIVDDAVFARKRVATARSALFVAPTYHPGGRRTGLALCGTW